jgi:hypothetical protein
MRKPAPRPPLPKRLDDRTERDKVRFLMSELETGLTFANLAMDSSDAEKIATNTRNARKAYETILRFLPETALTQTDEREIAAALSALQSELQVLGEFL